MLPVRNLLLFFVLFLVTHAGFSQKKLYSPVISNKEALAKQISISAAFYKKLIHEFEDTKYKKQLNDLFKKMSDDQNEFYKNVALLNTDELNGYLQQIVHTIFKSNPDIKKPEPAVYFSASDVVNAYTLPDGVIIINAGLVANLENESQLAFVLAHELAHYLKNHGITALKKNLNTLLSDDVQEKLRELSKQEYGVKKELEELEQSLTLNTRKHSRDHEFESDLYAVELLQNTPYDVAQSIPVLQLLDKVDTDERNMVAELKDQFNFAEYPFKEKWVTEQAAFFGGIQKTAEEKKREEDNQTHPDCKKRIEALQNYMKPRPTTSTNSEAFSKIKDVLIHEMIHSLNEKKDYSALLYHALKFVKLFPDDAFFLLKTCQALSSIYKNQKEHTLSRVVTLPSEEQLKSFKILNEMIQRLSLEDIRSIAFWYRKKHEATLGDNAEFEKSKKQLL